MDFPIQSIVLTLLAYVAASWVEESYDPMNWGGLTLVIAVLVVWSIWDPS